MPKVAKKKTRKDPLDSKQSPRKRTLLRNMCKWINKDEFMQLHEDHRKLFMQAFRAFEAGDEKTRSKLFMEKYGDCWACFTADTEAVFDLERVREIKEERKTEIQAAFRKCAEKMDEGEWTRLITWTQAEVKKMGKKVEPLLHDTTLFALWDEYVPLETQQCLLFKDESGDFFAYYTVNKLWEERDAKNAATLLYCNLYPLVTKEVGKACSRHVSSGCDWTGGKN